MTTKPDLSFEKGAQSKGFQTIAGVDEVGRGPLAGPVVAAAVILSNNLEVDGLNDSKKLSERRREMFFQSIMTSCHVGICSLPATHIDEHNIRQATHHAMVGAVRNLSTAPDFLLIDGREVPAGLTIPSKTIIKGDGISLSIAAASIIAKVTRDRMLFKADNFYPAYGFANHKGYGAQKHREAIAREGATDLHRQSFEPIKSMKKPANG